MGKKKINLDINTKEFEKRVRKAAKLAIDDVINNPNDGVIKTVKTKLQTAAKRELGDMSLRSKAQIAPNIDAIQKFENRCIGCTRYARNCSLLQKAIEGRVQDEIHDGVCLCYRRKGE